MIIREFQIGDINHGLLETYKEVWQIDEISNETLENWSNNDNTMFVVENNGEIIGTCTVHLQKKIIHIDAGNSNSILYKFVNVHLCSSIEHSNFLTQENTSGSIFITGSTLIDTIKQLRSIR